MDADKVKAIAKEKYGKELTDAEAIAYVEKYGKNGRLSDDELDNVSGGYSCDEYEYYHGVFCEPCQVWCDKHSEIAGRKAWDCPVCGKRYE